VVLVFLSRIAFTSQMEFSYAFFQCLYLADGKDIREREFQCRKVQAVKPSGFFFCLNG